MALSDPRPIDTRALFRPVSQALVQLLRGLPADDWERPTVAGAWAVRDVAAHLLDTTLRRLSFHRDAMTPPRPETPIASEREFVAFIDDLNARWVRAARRLSPRVLTDLLDHASREAADWFEALPFDAPALFPVSWAGEDVSAGWFDVGREFTELWHHQQQIRMAVGAPSLDDPRYLRAVLDVAMYGLPHAYRDIPAGAGDTVALDVTGRSGGQWTLRCDGAGWALCCGLPPAATTVVRLTDGSAWQLLFNALPRADAEHEVHIEGRRALAEALLGARSVVV